MDRDALDRARRRFAEAGNGRPTAGELETTLAGAKAGLESLAHVTAELEASVPTRLAAAIEDGLKAEVLPVARHVAEVRGLTGQVVRRLERLQADAATERRERLEDLALLVELVATGWQGVERRLDRLERVLDRIERALEERAPAPVYRIDGRGA